jgi:hypothetical protein
MFVVPKPQLISSPVGAAWSDYAAPKRSLSCFLEICFYIHVGPTGLAVLVVKTGKGAQNFQAAPRRSNPLQAFPRLWWGEGEEVFAA